MPQSYSNKPYIYTLFVDFIALLYPHICIGCNESLQQNEQLICLSCELELPKTHFENHSNNEIEKLFWNKSKIESATAGYFFSKKSRLQKMIHSFKYHGNKESAIYLGEKLGEILNASTRFNEIDLIIPVPLHPQKFKKRGFNQAEQIAIGVSNVLRIPVDNSSLIRTHHNETQTNKGVFNRWANVKTIFNVQNTHNILGKHILLLDDVITSGSTIESCANQLLKTDGVRVSIASLAVASG